jgi:hypothetical protein
MIMAEEMSEIERLKAENDKLEQRVARPYPPFRPEEHEGSEYLGGGMWKRVKRKSE